MHVHNFCAKTWSLSFCRSPFHLYLSTFYFVYLNVLLCVYNFLWYPLSFCASLHSTSLSLSPSVFLFFWVCIILYVIFVILCAYDMYLNNCVCIHFLLFALWGLLGVYLWCGLSTSFSCLNSISNSPIVITTRQPACTWDKWCDQKLMIDLEWPNNICLTNFFWKL